MGQAEKSHLEQFQNTNAHALFLCEQVRPEIIPTMAFLTTRIKASTEDDWSKLIRMMQHLRQSRNDVVKLGLLVLCLMVKVI